MSDITCVWGAPVLFSATFKNSAGTLADPTEVKLRVTPPGKDAVTYIAALNNPSTGAYNITIDLERLGEWSWIFIGTGSVVAQSPTGTVMVTGEEP